jgi:hypothetical protein
MSQTQGKRIQTLNKRDMLENDYVPCWMQASQRADENVARSAGCRVTQVESEVVVPVELASEKKQLSPFDDSGEVFEVLAGALLGVRENIRDCFSDLASRWVRVVHR